MDPRRLARAVDASAKARLTAAEIGFAQANRAGQSKAMSEMVQGGHQVRAADRIVERTPRTQQRAAEMGLPEAEAFRKEERRVVARNIDPTVSGPDQAARLLNQHVGDMNRGPGGFTQRGVLEGAAYMANDDMVRRGGLIAAGTGATVASGALMTAGAQQLLTLIDYLQHGQQVKEQMAKSPLLA